MKTNDRYRIKSGKIHSLEDLRREKLRLRMEIMKTEERIHSGYRDILSALTFKNLASSLVQKGATSSTVLAKALTIGQALLAKRKKKKRDREKEEPNPDTQ